MKLLGGRPSMYDEKINDLMGIGLPREDAIRQLTNMPKGQTFGVDLSGLDALEIPLEADDTKATDEARNASKTRETGKARNAWELVDTGHVTGFGSAFRSMTAHVFGGLGFPNNEDVLEARQELDIIVQQLARATAQSPRFAEAERQWILDTFDISPQIFNSPEGLKAELTAISNQFTNQMHNYMETAKNPSASKKEVENNAAKARILQNFIKLLGVPEQGQNTQEQGFANMLGINDAQAGQDQVGDESSPNIYWKIVNGKLVKIK